MKFVSHAFNVFQTFLNDFKALVATSEKTENASLRDKLLSKRNIFSIIVIADIISVLATMSKCIQVTDLLPWEYTDLITNINCYLLNIKCHLTSLHNCENVQQFIDIVRSLPKCFFQKYNTFMAHVFRRKYFPRSTSARPSNK